MARSPSDTCAPLTPEGCPSVVLCGISPGFPRLFHTRRYVNHTLLPLSPLGIATPLDLHASSIPPTFTLSQDQTLLSKFDAPDSSLWLVLGRTRSRITAGRSVRGNGNWVVSITISRKTYEKVGRVIARSAPCSGIPPDGRPPFVLRCLVHPGFGPSTAPNLDTPEGDLSAGFPRLGLLRASAPSAR